ncbi:hypothetical protein LPB140_03155 [Sphingorhabdus lutea]|uniref:Type II secretion system protein K n=1 Tax=Sphingorhabdus lutea TaxID=1913578 RepID=A0A1L3JA22_9SPHN|nr:type II secretion system minor pseudopilin GspK [Sphingorhabdus lutea]APG61982.1 hypothetical protein LPB140_03155 [Sphingorhabdus lutea]
MKVDISEHEKGAALLTVLLLVAVMSVIAASALDRLTLATKFAANGSAMAQARAYSYSLENIASRRIEDLISRNPEKLTLEGDWLERDLAIPIDGGMATINVKDANNCFNLNNLVIEGEQGLTANLPAIEQFKQLMSLLKIDESNAAYIAESAADWIDTDNIALPAGAEDSYYRGLSPSYLPANVNMVDRSELANIRGMTAQIYKKIKPYICALPTNEKVQVNLNTLSLNRAALFAMYFNQQMTIEQAQSFLANRPKDGYASLVQFWQAPMLASMNLDDATKNNFGLKSKWFEVHSRIAVGNIMLEGLTLMSFDSENGQNGEAQIFWRNWNNG